MKLYSCKRHKANVDLPLKNGLNGIFSVTCIADKSSKNGHVRDKRTYFFLSMLSSYVNLSNIAKYL